MANLHAKTLTEAADSLTQGELPAVPVDAAQTLIEGMVPAPTHAAMAEGVTEAAHDVPGYDAAASDVPRVELPPEKSPRRGWRATATCLWTSITRRLSIT